MDAAGGNPPIGPRAAVRTYEIKQTPSMEDELVDPT